MNTENLLHRNKGEIRRLVLEKLGKNDGDVEQDKRLLKSWFQYQKHLPEVPCDNILEAFLIVNKFNLEKCKKKLEMYYMIRKEIPDLYVDKNPKLQHMKDIANAVYIVPLPKLTPTLSRITIMKLKDDDPDKFDAINYFAHSYNIAEIRLREDVMLNDTLVYDMEGFQLGHVFKLRFGSMRKAAAVLEKVFSTRVEGIHYINLPSSMQIIINIVKTMLREKMRKRIHVHKDLDSLHQYVSKESLPQEYGGNEVSLNELHGLWLEKLTENQELFDYLEQFNPTVPETKEVPNVPVETDFKSLCVD